MMGELRDERDKELQALWGQVEWLITRAEPLDAHA